MRDERHVGEESVGRIGRSHRLAAQSLDVAGRLDMLLISFRRDKLLEIKGCHGSHVAGSARIVQSLSVEADRLIVVLKTARPCQVLLREGFGKTKIDVLIAAEIGASERSTMTATNAVFAPSRLF